MYNINHNTSHHLSFSIYNTELSFNNNNNNNNIFKNSTLLKLFSGALHKCGSEDGC